MRKAAFVAKLIGGLIFLYWVSTPERRAMQELLIAAYFSTELAFWFLMYDKERTMNDGPTTEELLAEGQEVLVAVLALTKTLQQERDRFRAALCVLRDNVSPDDCGQWVIAKKDMQEIVRVLKGER